MNLNAAMLRTGISGVNRDLEQMDTYTLNSQGGGMGGGRGSRQASRLDFTVDSLDRNSSRLDVGSYDPYMIPDRPGSRAVSVLQVGTTKLDTIYYLPSFIQCVHFLYVIVKNWFAMFISLFLFINL